MNTSLGPQVLALVNSDQHSGGKPQLASGSRAGVQKLLERLLVDRDALHKHIRGLQHVLVRDFRHNELLPDALMEAVIEHGLDQVDDPTLAALALNPVALCSLQQQIDEQMPEVWLTAMEEQGQELLREHGLRAPSFTVGQGAVKQMGSPILKHGDVVRIRTRRDRVGMVVREPRRIAGEFWYTIQFGPEQRQHPESALELHKADTDPFSLLRDGSLGSKRTFSKCITYTKLKNPLRDTLYSFRATRTQIHPYQFKPLIKLLESPRQRMLIADEVGLGKTIEAGFILRELRARQDIRRVLVVCPSRLCRKWKDELSRRFDEDFRILDTAALREFLREVEDKGDRATLKGICSLQTFRGRQRGDNDSSTSLAAGFLDDFEAASPPLDLVIVDEAHHLRNRETLSHYAGRVLNECADAMVLLTATPIHLGNENLFNLLNILDPEEFDRVDLFEALLSANEVVLAAERILRRDADLSLCKAELRKVERTPARERFIRKLVYQEVLNKLDKYDRTRRDQLVEIQRDFSQLNVLAHILTRTRKRDVDVKRAQRSAHVIPVDFNLDERVFYEQATDMCIDWYSRMSGDWAARFAVMMLQRQMASSLPAFLEKYQEANGDLLVNPAEEDASDLDPEDWGDVTGRNGTGTGTVTLKNDSAFRKLLGSHGHLRERDSKYDALVKALEDLDAVEDSRKVLLFSYFKGTLNYLERRLRADGFNCLVIHGDVRSDPSNPQADERGRRIRRFNEDPAVRILLSSEVGSEGLDFQHMCHILFNYDLPWNPMVVEQRIGRLDRLGQKKERIIIYNLSVKGTVEQRILDRLYNRIKIFEGSIGDLEPILGDEIKRLTNELLSSKLTAYEQEARIEERAHVLEVKRQETDKLERESSRFLGHDEFFNDEISRVQTRRRYLTADELRVFLTDFLETEFPKCTMQPARQDRCYWVTVTAELESFVRRYSLANDPALFDLLPRMHSGGFLITCDAEAAYENPESDLFHSQHPLARAIKAFYGEHPDRVHPAAKLRVASSRAPKADYLYFVSLFEVSGARPGRYLEAVFVPVDGGRPLDREMSEELLAEMVVKGETLDFEPEVSVESLEELRTAADDELGRRLLERRSELERVNDTLVESRLASLTASFESKRQKKSELLLRAEARQGKDHYIRMLRGGLRNIEADFEHRTRQLVEERQVDVQMALCAAGIVRVE